MALIRSGDASRVLGEAMVLDLGDLVRQGDQMRRRAEEEARRIIEDGERERQRLISGAREEGHALGYAAGLAEGRAVGRSEGRATALAESAQGLEALTTHWNAALQVFVSERERMFREAKDEVVRIALLLAEKVTRRAITANPGVVVSELEAVLAMLARSTRLKVQVHPEDEPLAREALPGVMSKFPMVEHLELVTSGSISRGSVIARTATGGVIDASIETQMSRIAEAMLPAEKAGGEA